MCCTCHAGRLPRRCAPAANSPSLQPNLSLLPCAVCFAAAAGATTKAGTWAPTEDDAKFIEMMADMEEKWQQVRAGLYR